MTIDVLSELMGQQNLNAVRNIMPLAISNAFYEQIYIHYGLEKLSFGNERSSTHQRGDILEAYMAGIEKDVSRNGQGYQEVRDWLLKVMALRLRLVASNTDGSSHFYSAGTVHQSFTVMSTLSQPSAIGGVSDDEFVTMAPNAVILSVPAAEPQAIKPSMADTMWSTANKRGKVHVNTEEKASALLPWTPRMYSSSTSSRLHYFRQFIFENMIHIFTQCQAAQSPSQTITLFWKTLKCTMNKAREVISEENQMVLLLYYRVYSI